MTQLKAEKRRRYQLLLSTSEQLFNRLNTDIHHIQSKNLSLIGFILANLSIIVALILFLFEKGWSPTIAGQLLIIIPIVLISISLFYSLKNFSPTKYLELDIFEKERLNEITKMSEEDFYSDIIYYYKEAYKFNKNKYNNMVKEVKYCIYFYTSAAISLLIIVMLIISGIL